MTKARLGGGDVAITLEGGPDGAEALTLKPTLKACQTISRLNGGIRGAMEAVVRLDFDTIVSILGIGLGYDTGSKEAKALPDRVYMTGLSDDSGGLVAACITFLRAISAGGAIPENRGDADKDPK